MSAFFMLENKVTLKVNGIDYSGWTSVSITTSLQSFYRSFSVASSRRIKTNGSFTLGFDIGDRVEVYIGQDKVITGYVKKVNVTYDSSSLNLRVDGVGCPWAMFSGSLPLNAPKTYEQMTLVDIIKNIAKSFDVAFKTDFDSSEKTSISFSAEESVKSKIEGLIKKKNFLLSEDESGVLVLLNPGCERKSNDQLSLGRNILECSKTTDANLIYSEYVVYGQGTNPDSIRPVTDNQLVGRSLGSSKIKRVLAKKQTGNAIQSDLDVRAAMLRDNSEANATSLIYKVQGWRQSNGELWRVNSFVDVIDVVLSIKRSYLIGGVTHSLSSQGTTSTLELVLPSAFKYVDLSSTEEKVKKANNLSSIGNLSDAKWTGT